MLNEKYLKYQKYLPSKKFTVTASVGAVLAIIIFIIFFMSSGREKFGSGERDGSKASVSLKVENQSITELIQNDSDKDTIPDWEEILWGTDKNKKITFGDTPDATYIENKKKELRIEQGASVDEAKLTETEKFAREFFTSYSAMKTSGQIDNNTINSFSNALGQKIINPNLVDRYKATDIKINKVDDKTTQLKYYEEVQKLFQSYQSSGLGEELEVIGTSMDSSGTGGAIDGSMQNTKLSEIASAYQDFGKKVIDISTPSSLTEYHLQIANNANNTGISVSSMTKMVSDPIVGLSGLSQYQKYSEDLVKSVADLETFLLKE